MKKTNFFALSLLTFVAIPLSINNTYNSTQIDNQNDVSQNEVLVPTDAYSLALNKSSYEILTPDSVELTLGVRNIPQTLGDYNYWYFVSNIDARPADSNGFCGPNDDVSEIGQNTSKIEWFPNYQSVEEKNTLIIDTSSFPKSNIYVDFYVEGWLTTSPSCFYHDMSLYSIYLPDNTIENITLNYDESTRKLYVNYDFYFDPTETSITEVIYFTIYGSDKPNKPLYTGMANSTDILDDNDANGQNDFVIDVPDFKEGEYFVEIEMESISQQIVDPTFVISSVLTDITFDQITENSVVVNLEVLDSFTGWEVADIVTYTLYDINGNPIPTHSSIDVSEDIKDDNSFTINNLNPRKEYTLELTINNQVQDAYSQGNTFTTLGDIQPTVQSVSLEQATLNNATFTYVLNTTLGDVLSTDVFKWEVTDLETQQTTSSEFNYNSSNQFIVQNLDSRSSYKLTLYINDVQQTSALINFDTLGVAPNFSNFVINVSDVSASIEYNITINDGWLESDIITYDLLDTTTSMLIGENVDITQDAKDGNFQINNLTPEHTYQLTIKLNGQNVSVPLTFTTDSLSPFLSGINAVVPDVNNDIQVSYTINNFDNLETTDKITYTLYESGQTTPIVGYDNVIVDYNDSLDGSFVIPGDGLENRTTYDLELKFNDISQGQKIQVTTIGEIPEFINLTSTSNQNSVYINYDIDKTKGDFNSKDKISYSLDNGATKIDVTTDALDDSDGDLRLDINIQNLDPRTNYDVQIYVNDVFRASISTLTSGVAPTISNVQSSNITNTNATITYDLDIQDGWNNSDITSYVLKDENNNIFKEEIISNPSSSSFIELTNLEARSNYVFEIYINDTLQGTTSFQTTGLAPIISINSQITTSISDATFNLSIIENDGWLNSDQITYSVIDSKGNYMHTNINISNDVKNGVTSFAINNLKPEETYELILNYNGTTINSTFTTDSTITGTNNSSNLEIVTTNEGIKLTFNYERYSLFNPVIQINSNSTFVNTQANESLQLYINNEFEGDLIVGEQFIINNSWLNNGTNTIEIKGMQEGVNYSILLKEDVSSLNTKTFTINGVNSSNGNFTYQKPPTSSTETSWTSFIIFLVIVILLVAFLVWFSKRPDEKEKEKKRKKPVSNTQLLSLYDQNTREDEIKYKSLSAIKAFIPSFDLINTTYKQIRTNSDLKDVPNEIKTMLLEYYTLLKNENVIIINPKPGMKFNFDVHEAVDTEINSSFNSGEVIEVLRPGYKLHNKLIQPAWVKVAK